MLNNYYNNANILKQKKYIFLRYPSDIFQCPPISIVNAFSWGKL